MTKVAVVLAIVLCLGCVAFAADFTGYVADSNCAAKMGAKAAGESHADCAARCIKGGAAAVLVTPEGKVYKLAEQEKVKEFAGQKVKISGSLDEETISVSEISKAE